MATLFMIDGFEHGNSTSGVAGVYDAVAGTPAIVTSPVRTGARAREISAAAAAENVQYSPAAGNRIGTVAVYFRFASLPGADFRILSIRNATSNGYLLYRQSAGTMAVFQSGGSIVTGGPTIAIDTWYRAVVEHDTTANPYVIRCTIDGGTEFSTSRAVAAADLTAFQLGTDAAETGTVYLDDFICSVTDGDYEELGTLVFHSVESLIPSADGSHSITTSGNFDDITDAFDDATTNSYLNIQDVPLNITDTADNIIRQDAADASGYMEHLYDDLPASTDDPIDVRVYAVDVDGAAAGTNGNILRFLLPADVPATPDVRLSTDDPGITVIMRKKVLDRPGGGWTRANVNALKSRWGFGSGTPAAHLLGVMIEVALGPHIALPEDAGSARRSLIA